MYSDYNRFHVTCIPKTYKVNNGMTLRQYAEMLENDKTLYS